MAQIVVCRGCHVHYFVYKPKMPANSALFNRFFLVLTASYVFISPALGQLAGFSQAHYQWLGQQVFANECNRQLACLTHWNDGEDFPSLGIGHFIWYRQGQTEVFEETFPKLLEYLQQQGVVLPAWLDDPINADNPWPDQASFEAASESQSMQQLRVLLQSTMDLQAAFIVARLEHTAADLIASVPPQQREPMQQVFRKIATSNPPMGAYALIDYLHFKGSGLNTNERYQQQGWGLKQVLLRLHQDSADLQNFVAAATDILSERVANAPPERNEQRWLQGWHNRLQTYLP